MSKEIWKDIVGYDSYKGLYQVSNKGRVKRLCRTTSHGLNLKEKILKVQKRGYGYLGVSFHDDKSEKAVYIHRLVALAFINNPHNYKTVNHIDEDKTNNAVENLEWMTQRSNNNHSANKKSTSKYSGVCWDRRAEKWKAYCRFNRKINHLGYFDLEENAAQAYICFCAIHNLK